MISDIILNQLDWKIAFIYDFCPGFLARSIQTLTFSKKNTIFLFYIIDKNGIISELFCVYNMDYRLFYTYFRYKLYAIKKKNPNIVKPKIKYAYLRYNPKYNPSLSKYRFNKIPSS